jgi:hypothetical protein
MNGSLYAILLYLVLYLQDGLHYSALGTGLRLLVITVVAMTTSILAGRLSHYVPIRWLHSNCRNDGGSDEALRRLKAFFLDGLAPLAR